MNRFEFLQHAGLAALSVSVFGKAVPTSKGNFEGDCRTTNDILGPFFRKNAPQRHDLTWDELPGNRIELSGTVYGQDCKSPVKGAKVEIWHCDTQGRYDNETDRFDHRAMALTDEDGQYAFKTILPGKYLNGALYRPAHIHFRVTAPGQRELVSQLYFKGDPHIEKDPWASDEKAAYRIRPIALKDTEGNLSVTFDLYL
ncbi:MAG: hypothetical protein AB8F95_17880 [Bacteroidia bacterium]